MKEEHEAPLEAWRASGIEEGASAQAAFLGGWHAARRGNTCNLSLAALEVIVQALEAFRADESWKTNEQLIAFPKMMALAQQQRDVGKLAQVQIEYLLAALGDVLAAPELELPTDPPGLEVSIIVARHG